MQTNDPLLVAADPAEVSDHLLDSGVSGVSIVHRGDHLVIEAPAGDIAIEAALSGWTPTTTGFIPGEFATLSWVKMPSYVKDHVQHLRDYRTLVRGGGTPTNAQTAHVIADLIDALRFVNSRITGD